MFLQRVLQKTSCVWKAKECQLFYIDLLLVSSSDIYYTFGYLTSQIILVIPTYLEPVPGWINNFYGPTGIVVAVAIGVLRVLHCVGETNAQIVPVDMCVNSILASGWDVAKNKYDSPPVYNYVGSQTNTISWKSYMEINSAYGKDKSLSKAIWFYSLYLSPSKFVVMILQFFLHVLPAAFVDFACIIAGKKFR